jgi:ubiquitin C-terminal hydrolase
MPTWLLEVGHPIVLSVASLSHYYYFGRVFCPLGLEPSSQRKRKFAVNAKAVVQWITHILTYSHSPLNLNDVATIGNNTNSMVSDILDGSRHEKLPPAPKRTGSASGGFRQRRTSHTKFSTEESHTTLPSLASIPTNPASMRSQTESKVMQYLQAVKDGRIPVDNFEMTHLSQGSITIEGDVVLWSMEEFVRWADEVLQDRALNTIFSRLMGSGVLPTSDMEKHLVKTAWQEWQASDMQLWSENSPLHNNTTFLSQPVLSLLSVPNKKEQMDKAKYPPWGGVGGFDGKGGLGYGVLFCIDKKWWDSWESFVGWSWSGDTEDESPVSRPGELSNETLLNRFSDYAIAGTLGSHEIMKENLRRDVDYVLIPPAVWDILYELYAGGPPLPRMVLPPPRFDGLIGPRSRTMSCDSKQMESEDGFGGEIEIVDSNLQLMRIPDTLSVATHPWILHCHICDPSQPYRRGDAGSISIRIMAMPYQPLWRVYAEIITRLPVQSHRAVGNDGFGKARLWKFNDTLGPKDTSFRYGPWVLLCKNRSAILPIIDSETDLEEAHEMLVLNWQAYTDSSTVEGSGLSNGERILFEHAVQNKSGDLVWPREAAAKAGHAKRLIEEDTLFRRKLKGLDDSGKLISVVKNLIGLEIDAMDSSGRWYHVVIIEAVEVSMNGNVEKEEPSENTGDEATNVKQIRTKSRNTRQILVDFSPFGGHEEWIEVESDRLAVPGRFTLDDGEESSTMSNQQGTNDPKAKAALISKKSSEYLDQNGGKACILPGYGACGLANLGNTCYANAAIQCISYMPLLRSYLLSAQYKSMGDLNKDNPLGTGGKLLEEFADLLRIMWCGKFGERSPTKFRNQLGKQRAQFSGSDQHDAQEFLNYMLDVLHEDSNKVKKKPYVEALEDDWVMTSDIPRVGEESWRRFLRRNQSIMGDVAMGQVLNTVACPNCDFSSRSFDPFNLLSIPFPTVSDIFFRCTVVRRATPLNCSQVLNLSKKNKEDPRRYNLETFNDVDTQPPSERLVCEEYIIPMSRLADIGDLRLRLQNICGIAANRLRLCRAEHIVLKEELEASNPLRMYTRMTQLPDKEGPCLHVAKNSGMTDEANNTSSSSTHIFVFENTLSPRPMAQFESKVEDDEDTVGEDEEDEEVPLDEKTKITTSEKEKRILKDYLKVYGDGKECRIYDTNPIPIAKAISRSLWPETENDFNLGLRVDATDPHNHWFPGSIVEIIEGVASDSPTASKSLESATKTKVRVHFDNFSSKWDETYTIDHFTSGKVRPLYSHSTPRPKNTEFMIHHRYEDKTTEKMVLFGQPFLISCQNEWSTARAAAHIFAQTSRFLTLSNLKHLESNDAEQVSENDLRLRRHYEKVHASISELIDVLLDFDRSFCLSALGVSADGLKDTDDFVNRSFDSTSLSSMLVKKVGALLHRIPFELKVCMGDSLLGAKTGNSSEEVSYPFSLLRTIGNYMNPRHSVVLFWRESQIEKKPKFFSIPVMYTRPVVGIHQQSATLLVEKPENQVKTNTGSGGMHLSVCLTEFCKVNQLNMNDNWKCPRCKEFREGKQTMNLWRLPDLLTFHMKRFNCSARWREKITTKVNFPLTGLDMTEWCHKESPALQKSEAPIYDLIAVVNHYGGMTGGHYVATCKATPCSSVGSEEVSYSFPGQCTSTWGGVPLEEEVGSASNNTAGWRFRKEKDTVTHHKAHAAKSLRQVCDSAEPIWLQFDDELVEPIPPRNVVSEMAYVLFYRRRQITPSNIAKYCSLE